MNIDSHAHIFTLHSVLSRETIRILGDRLRSYGVPGFVVEAVEKLLDEQLDRPEYFDDRALLGRLLAKLAATAGFQEVLTRNLARLPFDLSILGDGLEELPGRVLERVLDRISTILDDGDAPGTSIHDVVKTLQLCMRPTITDVADEILEQMGADDVLVALMMDIREPQETPRDQRNFMRQLAGTSEAVLQRPGRILPFFAVHPLRPGHFDLMRDALERRGFVGVKLYPSLGYQVDDPKLMAVYQYCVDSDVPVLYHCSHGGFYASPQYIDNGDPQRWSAILDGGLSDLRVCFGHMNGWGTLGEANGLAPGAWGHTVVQLMRDKPNVFADLSNHTGMINDPQRTQRYFTNLKQLLQDDRLRQRLLFGTDSWLLRLHLDELCYWRYYRERLSADEFTCLAETAPRLFLGFPDSLTGALRENLRRHVDFLASNRDRVGAEPAEWVRRAVGAAFTVARDPADWDPTRPAVRRTYQFLGHYIPDQIKSRGFKHNRDTRLRELSYYRPNDPNFDMIVTANARDFVAFCKQGAEYEGSYTDTSATDYFIPVFERGESRLVDVAAMVEAVFHFSKEIA